MTMPNERYRALAWAGEYLRERRQDPALSDEDRREIATILRHYPDRHELRDLARRHPETFAVDPESPP